jgi:ribosomal protein S18 acetylase RimI-like enzyme
LPRSQAQKRLVANWINIVLTIISVTQGVVVGFLLSQFPNAFNCSIASWNFIFLALYLLCLVISVRVFQTIITGVLDEEFTMPNLYEFSLVFVVVSVEHYLFSLFGNLQSPKCPSVEFNVGGFLTSFHKWGITLSVMGAFGYAIKLWRLKRRYKRHHKRRDDYYYTELWLHRRNIFGLITLMAIESFLLLSSSGILNFGPRGNGQIPLVGVMIAILFANINYSLWATFGENLQMSQPATQLAQPERGKLEIKIAKAKKEDVAELRNLLMQYFGYVYKALFGNGKKDELPVSKMLESILKARRGKHALGYESFCVAHPTGSRKEIVGMLLLKSSAGRWRRFMTAWSITKLVLLNFGLRGLLRVWRNWSAIRSISQKVASNELHIVYLAVSTNAQDRRVGTQLLEYAKQIAKEKGKDLITLCVRENNPKAERFFEDHGFEKAPDSKVDKKADDLLGQGALIRMFDKRAVDKY